METDLVLAPLYPQEPFLVLGRFRTIGGLPGNVSSNGRVARGIGFISSRQPTIKKDRIGCDLPVFQAVPHGVWKAAKNNVKRSTAGRWYSGKKQAPTLSGAARRRAQQEAA